MRILKKALRRYGESASTVAVRGFFYQDNFNLTDNLNSFDWRRQSDIYLLINSFEERVIILPSGSE